MNARVSVGVIWGPLSDTASRIGRPGSSTGEVETFVGQQVEQPFDLEGPFEDDPDLGGGLLDRDEGVDPAAAHHVDDGRTRPASLS